MQVKHALSRVPPRVENQAITTLAQALAGCQLFRRAEHASKQGRVCLRQVIRRRKVLLRDDQQVHRRQRLDVANREAQLVVVHPIDRDSTRRELTKQAI